MERRCCSSTSRCPNLDAKLRRRVREEIRDLQLKLNLTVAYVTHIRKRRWPSPTHHRHG